jgi:hypothetical protein
MRGVTITFTPNKNSNKNEYNLPDGAINKFINQKTGYLSEAPLLYNSVRSIVGDVIYNTSQTYRNSDFTIFIRMGTTGGGDAGAQDAVVVYGQYNGTNLSGHVNEMHQIASNGPANNEETVDVDWFMQGAFRTKYVNATKTASLSISSAKDPAVVGFEIYNDLGQKIEITKLTQNKKNAERDINAITFSPTADEVGMRTYTVRAIFADGKTSAQTATFSIEVRE